MSYSANQHSAQRPQPAAAEQPSGDSVEKPSSTPSSAKMTKSYLLESEAYLKTNCKSMASSNTPVPVADAPASRIRRPAHNHGHHTHHHHHHNHHHHNHHHHNSHQSSVTDDLLRGINIWNAAATRDPIVSGAGQERGKPLTLHNIAGVQAATAAATANYPPIAYINGNSVRPIRCRHYSAQQTSPAVLAQQAQAQRNMHNHNHNSNTNSAQVSMMATAPVTGNRQPMNRPNSVYNDSDSEQPNGGGAQRSSGSAPTPSLPRTASSSSASSSASSANSTVSLSTATSAAAVAAMAAPMAAPMAAAAAVDDDFDEKESNVYSLYGGENSARVIAHLGARIEGVLRAAKQSRRLVCNELLVPQALIANIAQDVIKTAESEPCGLRGCVLRICIEDTPTPANSGHSSKSSTSSGSSGPGQASENGGSALSASRLLGEVVLDRSLVSTFEIFLVLKRARTNWLDSLESKLLGRERIVLSEIYLLHKKKLY